MQSVKCTVQSASRPSIFILHYPLSTLHLNRPRASLRDRVSKTQFARGSTEAACQVNFRGRGRQAMHLPCKQAHVGALPIDSTISLRGE